MSEEDKGSIRAILLDLSALNFSQAARIKLHATKRRRHLALDCLKLPKDFNDQAVDRVSRAGPQIFGGKCLEAVDTDLTMNKRAKEVADRFKPRQSGCIVFAADSLPSLRAKGALVPDSGDDPAFSSLDTGEAIDLLPPVDVPPLNPSDYMVGLPVNTVPVGGRLSLFVAQWQNITRDHFIISVVRQGFQISVQVNFPGV